MIQRKQTLFLFASALLGLSLLFLPSQTLITANGPSDVVLTPLQPPFISTPLHLVAIALNFAAILLAFVSIFLYKKRAMQVKFCYGLVVLWLALTLLMGSGTFVLLNDPVVAVDRNLISLIAGVSGIFFAYLASRFIKKDIELLKSADRIR